MYKKIPAIFTLTLLLLPGKFYAQQPASSPKASASPAAAAAKASPSPGADTTDYSSLPPAKIVDKLQDKIIAWQDFIINGMQAQIILPNLYREMAGVAVDSTDGKVKDQKMLDLLSKYGIGVNTKDGKKINTPSTTSPVPEEPAETAPFIEIKDGASREEKAHIRALLEKCQALVDRANASKKVIAGLQAVILDLLQLAKTDDGAKAIVDKYHIRQQAPIPTPAPSATP